MITKNVIGQKIVRVNQSVRSVGRDRGRCNVVDSIVLENGIRLVPITIETDWGEYAHEFQICEPGLSETLLKPKRT